MNYRFRASRLSPGNVLFPTVIEVNDRHVTRIKPSFVTRIEESISIRQVSSVTIKRGIMWADIVIHSSGGTAPLLSTGHTNADAERLKEIIEDYQTSLLQTGTADSSMLRVCPRCAELVKAAARVCRFCQHELPIELTEEAEASDGDGESQDWRFN
jgi:hypothetical protein